MAREADVLLRVRERLARRHKDLLPDQIDPRDELRDRVLDLDPRVHLQEPVVAVPIEQALDVPALRYPTAAPRRRRCRRSGRAARATAGDGVSSTSF